MERHGRETGAALILLLGIIATLAIIAATLVMAIGNQQGATARERTRKTSLYYAEGALDAAVTLAKTKTIPTTNTGSSWLPMSEVQAALVAAGFPAGATLTGFAVYDNLTPVDTGIWWDSNGDGIVWVEVTVTYQGRTTRMRVLVRQATESVVKSFPKAAVYSDTGVNLEDSSDVYALEPDNVTPYDPASHGGAYATTIMAGGGKYTAAHAQDFIATSSANLAAPGATAQSVNIQANGTVSPSGAFAGTITGGVGLLSDYFDQAAQADLGDEAQVGEAHAAAPTAPTAPSVPSPTPTTTLTSTDVTNIQSSTQTTDYTTYQNTSVTTASATNITISRATARRLYFKDLRVRGNLSVTGPVTLIITGFLRVDGTLTLNNTGAAITDTFSGAVYVGSASASSVAGNVALSCASSLRTGGALTLSNTGTTAGQLYAVGNLSLSGNTAVTATSLYAGGALSISGATSARTDQFGSVYVAGTGNSGVSGTVTLNATSSVYAAGTLTLSNTLTTTGLLYAASTSVAPSAASLSISGNATVRSTALVVQGDFTISGATSAVTDQFAAVWAGGASAKTTWSGTASVQTTNYTDGTAKPGPMWITILNRSGTFNDVYGDVWLTGNAGTSNVAWQVTGPASGTACTIMCPLLATTEKTEITGKVNFGTTSHPMVYYMMCDNDQLYSNDCQWGSTGTFYGLMVVMEACLVISDGNGTTPNVVGAVFEGTPYLSGTSDSVYDVRLTDSSTVAYSQSVIDAVTNTAITTITTTTQIVPGSWQQLPLH